jgi:membrane protease YdiL (CAAX protease family)
MRLEKPRSMQALPDSQADDDADRAYDDALPAGHTPADADALPRGTDFDAEQTGLAAESPAAPGYWALSRTPLTSLVFSLPLVLAYEGGVLWLGRGTPRNGADVWLRQLLDACGFGGYFLLPVLTIVGLLAWHHVEHDRWHFSPAVLMGMAGECVLWAVALIGIARLQQQMWPLELPHVPIPTFAAAPGPPGGLLEGALAHIIGYCGAGLYEEVLFRLLLLPAVAWLLGRLGAGPIAAAVWAILITSTLFSMAHYVGPLGDAFELYSFSFRLAAGVFFAVVFLLRGFGIVAGTHAFYDLLVGLV